MPEPVPKFGSFRPKKEPTDKALEHAAEQPQKHERPHSHRGHDSESERRRHRHRDKNETGIEPESDIQRRNEDAHSKRAAKSTLIPVTSPGVAGRPSIEESSKEYVIDLVGDPKNLEYGSLHRYDIPLYRTIGCDRIIGLDPCYRIDRGASTLNQLVIIDTRRRKENAKRAERFLTKRHYQRELRATRLIGTGEEEGEFETGADFVWLSSSRKRKRGSESPEPDANYRSIEGKAKAEVKPSDTDLEYLDESDGGGKAIDEDVESRQHNAVLARKVKEEPENADAWLQLLDHQAAMVRPGTDLAVFSNSERRTLADLRLSIYTKALRSVSGPGHEQLQLGMLEEGSRIWDQQTRLSKCQEVLKETPHSHALWIRYMDVLQTSNTRFKYEDTKQAFIACLLRLRDATHAGTNMERLQSIWCYVLLRLVVFVRDAGYEELALATWQALFEYGIFQPTPSTEPLLDRFESFWDNEGPRFGEPAAKGWNASDSEYGAGAAALALDSTADGSSHVLDATRPFGSFADAEQHSSDASILPGRTLDEQEVDDPYHLILFSDLRPTLESCSSALHLDSLLDVFLCFFGIPPLPSTAPLYQWRNDALIRQFPPPSTSNLQAQILDNYQTTTSLLFGAAFPSLDTLDPKTIKVLTFVSNSLSQLTARHPTNDSLAEYYLAFTVAYFPATALKTSRSLSKSRPTSLRLYNACALICVKLGQADKAAHIWSTSLRAVESLPAEKRTDAVVLWHSWIWHELRDGNRDNAMKRLLRFGLGDAAIQDASDEATAAARLRVQRVSLNHLA